jgi:hypothetical protein
VTRRLALIALPWLALPLPALPPAAGAPPCWPAAPPAAVPDALAAFVHRRCLRCHGGDSPLDLRRLPAPGDGRSWKRLALAVETGRMPPPQEGSAEVDLARRFPLPGPERDWFARTVRTATEVRWTPPLVRSLELPERLQWLRRAGRLTGQDVDPILHRVELDRHAGSDLVELQLTLAAHQLCAAVVDQRPTLAEGSSQADAALVAALQPLALAPTDSPRRMARTLATLRRQTGSPREAAIALCTGQLSGPASGLLGRATGCAPGEPP